MHWYMYDTMRESLCHSHLGMFDDMLLIIVSIVDMLTNMLDNIEVKNYYYFQIHVG